ncbi:beta-ketoacyl synthase N-terminal-like domain-containing protein [Escherichia coli]
MGGFAAAKARSYPQRRAPEGESPVGQDRDGFVLGDGAGVLVLEEYEHAKARAPKDLCRAGWLWHEWRCLSYDGTSL